MATSKLRGNDLRKIGYPEGRAISLALDILEDRQLKKLDKGSALATLQKIKRVRTATRTQNRLTRLEVEFGFR